MARARVRGRTIEAPETPRTVELAETLKVIHKRFGGSTAVNASRIYQPPRLTTGIFALDLATFGGIPRGKLTMFHGPRSSGKTTSALKTIAGQQRVEPDKTHVLVDQEHAYDPVWGDKLGVDNDKLLVIQPDSGEQTVDMIEALLRTIDVGLVVLDSVAAMVPMKEIEDSAEDAHVGIHAKLVTRMVRKSLAAWQAEAKRDHYPTLLVLNQQRSAIGKWAPPGQEAINLPGGKALEFFTGLQVGFRNLEKRSSDDDKMDALEYNEHKFTIDKNKWGSGIRTGEFTMYRRDDEDKFLLEGDIDDAITMVTLATKFGLYTGGGTRRVLQLPGREPVVVSNREALFREMYQDRDLYWALRTELIVRHCMKYRMPEYVLDNVRAMVNPFVSYDERL